jgi:hypothetical protein
VQAAIKNDKRRGYGYGAAAGPVAAGSRPLANRFVSFFFYALRE